ncbi:nuclear transport factor 2 family protein [Phenylobacterium sp.]|uniref:nuclear transport factor 2 family protein n=1 Tax=Phenylobacterium sp. TaxID=1871053 RepID=UPI00301C83B1
MSDVEARLAALEKELGVLRDREAIRDVIHRYCRAADRCDLQAFKDCYWSDGFDDHGFFGGNAHEFCDYVIPVLRKIEASRHAITNTIIDLEGDRAFCESQWAVIHRLREGDEFLDFCHEGRYLDIFEKRDGVWKILIRTAATDLDRLYRAKDLRAMLAGERGAANRGPENNLPRGARHPDDPVYVGFDLANLAQARAPIADLWAGFYALGKVL